MNPDKASTLRLLREGMGRTVNVVETKGKGTFHEVRAHLPDCPESGLIPILFLVTSLAFLEASPAESDEVPGLHHEEFNEVDGWTPADFLQHLRLDKGFLKITLAQVRGRSVCTEVTASPTGELLLRTWGRGQSANRWLAFVRGHRHLKTV